MRPITELRNILLLLLFFLAFVMGCANSTTKSSFSSSSGTTSSTSGLPPTDKTWVKTFDEEFDGTSVDTDVWNIDNNYTCGASQGCLSSRWAANVSVNNNVLELTTKKEMLIKDLPWTTGAITTRFFSQEYGFFEAKIRYGAATGLNNAFWLYSVNKAGVEPFEIDINEGHYTANIQMTLHNLKASTQVQSIIAEPADLSGDYHVYAIEWNKDEIIWYFDGKQVWKTPNTCANGQAGIHISTAVLPSTGAVTDDLDGTSMKVQWVRVYSRTD